MDDFIGAILKPRYLQFSTTYQVTKLEISLPMSGEANAARTDRSDCCYMTRFAHC